MSQRADSVEHAVAMVCDAYVSCFVVLLMNSRFLTSPCTYDLPGIDSEGHVGDERVIGGPAPIMIRREPSSHTSESRVGVRAVMLSCSSRRAAHCATFGSRDGLRAAGQPVERFGLCELFALHLYSNRTPVGKNRRLKA